MVVCGGCDRNNRGLGEERERGGSGCRFYQCGSQLILERSRGKFFLDGSASSCRNRLRDGVRGADRPGVEETLILRSMERHEDFFFLFGIEACFGCFDERVFVLKT